VLAADPTTSFHTLRDQRAAVRQGKNSTKQRQTCRPTPKAKFQATVTVTYLGGHATRGIFDRPHREDLCPEKVDEKKNSGCPDSEKKRAERAGGRGRG